MKGDFSRQTFDPKKHYSSVLMQQGRVQVDADWNEQQAINQYRIETETKDVIGKCGVPKHGGGFKIASNADGDLTISPGRIYVDGILCQLEESNITYATQPDYPNPEYVIQSEDNPPTLQLDNGNYLIYLDVWQRHITALDDERIREVALGGADTATRTKTVWQVRILPFKETEDTITCNTPIDFPAASTGKLNARTKPIENPKDPCLIPPSAGYLRLENQLYRVEVHQPGKLGEATFKWSRENGSVVTNIEKFDGNNLIVRDVGRDDFLGFASNNWVEIVDERTELNRQLGQLVQIEKVELATRTITLKTAPTAVEPKWHPKLRRWDSSDAIKVEVTASNDGWIPLEEGIEVKFSDGYYNRGDYWLIPARTATGQIEWESDLPQPPLGIQHHYCRLAVVRFDDNESIDIQDCRKHFPPLTELPTGGAGCCTVTVGDGVRSVGDFNDIQEAIASLLQKENGGKLCILAGTYNIRETIFIEGGRNLIISGCDRQTRIQGVGEQPVFQLDNCSNVKLESLRIEAESNQGAILAKNSANISFSACQIINQSGLFNLSIQQGRHIKIINNQMRFGGIWLADGAADVLIQDNQIIAGKGAGIMLGGVLDRDLISNKLTGISKIDIISNSISQMDNSGISTLAENRQQFPDLGDIEDIAILENRIIQCARGKPNAFFDPLAVGGIVLQDVSKVRIHNNQILDNGANVRSCGIYISLCLGLEITNNTILNNGVTQEQTDDISTVQAGIAALFLVGGSGTIPLPNQKQPITFGSNIPAALIHNNIVVCPQGQALLVSGWGAISVLGNSLTSQGISRQPSLLQAFAQLGQCAFIFNAGAIPGLSSAMRGFGFNTGVHLEYSAVAPPRTQLPDGRVLFNSNQVTLQVPNQVSQMLFAAVGILSFDDVSLQDNQIQSEVDGGLKLTDTITLALLTNVIVLAPTVRASGNRFTELPTRALLSYYSWGALNIATHNQATHCFLSLGNQVIKDPNQVIITEYCPALESQFAGR